MNYHSLQKQNIREAGIWTGDLSGPNSRALSREFDRCLLPLWTVVCCCCCFSVFQDSSCCLPAYLELFHHLVLNVFNKLLRLLYIWFVHYLLTTVSLHQMFWCTKFTHTPEWGRHVRFVLLKKKKDPGLMFMLKMSVFVSTQVLIFLKMSLTLKDIQKAVTY